MCIQKCNVFIVCLPKSITRHPNPHRASNDQQRDCALIALDFISSIPSEQHTPNFGSLKVFINILNIPLLPSGFKSNSRFPPVLEQRSHTNTQPLLDSALSPSWADLTFCTGGLTPCNLFFVGTKKKKERFRHTPFYLFFFFLHCNPKLKHSTPITHLLDPVILGYQNASK